MTIYYALVIVFAGIDLDDSITRLYHYAGNRDRREISESVRNQKVRNITKVINSKEMSKDKKNKELDKLTRELLSFNSDSEYRKKEVDKYIRNVKAKRIIRKIRIVGEILVGELLQLTPLFTLLITQNVFYSIVVSGLVMTMFSLYQEKTLSESMEYMYGKEVADEIMSQGKTKLVIVSTSFIKQIYFYVLLILI